MIPFLVWLKKLFGFINREGVDGHSKSLHDRKK